jgi:hypothetical protein
MKRNQKMPMIFKHGFFLLAYSFFGMPFLLCQTSAPTCMKLIALNIYEQDTLMTPFALYNQIKPLGIV